MPIAVNGPYAPAMIVGKFRRRFSSCLLLAVLATIAGNATAHAGGAEVGDRFEVRASDLPPPYDTVSVSNGSRKISRPRGALIRVPEGFHANIFAKGLSDPRWLTVAANGDVLVAESMNRRIKLLRDSDGDGEAEHVGTFAKRRGRPHGLAIQGDHLYVANIQGVLRYPYRPGDDEARGKGEYITAPGAFGLLGGHWTRNLAFNAAGTRFFVTIGSYGNLGEEPNPRATVQIFDADGGNQRTFASGIRNPVGVALYPGGNDVYVVVNERDGLGDELVPDYLTRLEDGDFLGWPYAYTGQNPQPGYAEKRPDLVARSKVPDVLFRSHSAPLGLVFYDADQFPPDYRGDAFVSLHGSWNASLPRGYMVARVRFENGRPVGHYEAFATGFWAEGVRRAKVWGRPAGLAIAKDGSLLVADDTGGVIWRVSFGN